MAVRGVNTLTELERIEIEECREKEKGPCPEAEAPVVSPRLEFNFDPADFNSSFASFS